MDSPPTNPDTPDPDGPRPEVDLNQANEGSQSSGPGRWILAALGVAAVAAFFLFAAFSGGDGATDAGDEAEVAAADSPIANLVFTTEDGTEATLADFRGEPIVLNFFASWCAPCRAEMPEFEEVHLAREGEVKFLGVNHDIDQASWFQFIDETEITFETVFQPDQEIWTELDAKGMPSTAFITPDGEVKELWTGVLNQELLEEMIDEHLTGGA